MTNIICKKLKMNGKEYMRVDDGEPIWFLWSDDKQEYQMSYNASELENIYLETVKND
jgi:hypothetical protein